MTEQIKHYENKLAYEMDSFDLAEALKNGEKVVVIDARRVHGYEQEHIAGAVNFPHRNMTEESTRHLDREVLYVTYCDGIGCNASTKGALKLAQLGFRVKELIGGLAWWKLDGYATERTAGVTEAPVQCAC